MQTIETFTDTQSRRWEYKAGENAHAVWVFSFSKKTKLSRKETWNPTLMVKGPKSWNKVSSEWAKFKAAYEVN